MLLAFASFAPQAEAANARFFGPIVADECYCDDGSSGNGNTLTVSAPDFGCVLQTAQNAMNFLISLGVIIAILYTVWVGYTFMTSMGNPGALEKAKGRFGSLLLGMFLVLAAWLLVDFVMKELYKPESTSGRVTLGPWNAILESGSDTQCLKPSPDTPSLISTVINTVASTSDINSPSGRPTGPGVDSDELTHTQAKSMLEAAGISISSSGNCSDRTNPRCTSLEGIKTNTVRQAIAVKNACGCDVTVTGGTETGHAAGTYSHANGFKIDLRVTGDLDRYLTGLTRSGSRGSDARYLDRCNNEYVKEGSPRHWDITVTQGVCSPPKQ